MNKIVKRMRDMILRRREVLNSINLKDVVYVKYNGTYWKSLVVNIRPHKIALPEFRVRSLDDNSLNWVSGVQIFTEDEVSEDAKYDINS